MAPRRLLRARPARLLRTPAERRNRRFCHNSNSSPLLAFAPPVVLQVDFKETDLQRSTTAPAAVAEGQGRQGTTGLAKEEGHKESLVATPKQAPAFNSGRSDTEEGAPDLRPPSQDGRLLSPPTIDRRRASAVASVKLPLANVNNARQSTLLLR